MPVAKYLDISTAHLQPDEMAALENKAGGRDRAIPVFVPHEYGAWVQVVGKVEDDELEASRASTYPNLQAVIELARREECSWINFDRDAEKDPSLPTFDW